jgi:hypothetical protein
VIQTYFDQIKALIDRFAATPFVLHTQLHFETRQGDQGYTTGTITFMDGSQLHFREYLDGTGGDLQSDVQIGKVSYSYHFQDSEWQMLFRYDNAAHKPAPPAQEHKHVGDTIAVASAPTLEDVLVEILILRRWI